MAFWSRIANVLRGDRVNREIDDELESHIAEAIEQGRDPSEARRAFGSVLQTREQSRDVRLLGWLDSLRADAIFGWRQLTKRKVTSAAAILSLGLGIGACVSAFRLIDALLLRPLPVAKPEQLYALCREGVDFDGQVRRSYSWAYPSFQLMRDAVKDQAELLALSDTEAADVTYRSDAEMEKAYLQYVSGSMFGSFGLRPALGRLLTGNDDQQPGKHPYAVLSYDYWKRRFALDPTVAGRTFRLGERLYEIVGVGPEGFTGTETGTVTDLFLPAMMHRAVTHSDWTWMQAMARLKPGVAVEPVRQKLNAVSLAFEQERAKGFTGMTRQRIASFLAQTLMLDPAASGVSELQHDYRRALLALGVLVALVLLIACANVANLMTAQAASRAREMALRVAIGAGRWRLVQLVLVESVWLAGLAGALGGLLAWWSAPFVVSRIDSPDHPVRLALPADWRVLGFGLVMTLAVTILFGLAPALRASGVKPASALKGGADPHSRQRVMNLLIAVQVAFCFLVLFVAGLFSASFDRLANRPMGFSAERVLTLDTVTQRAESPAYWDQVAAHLRDTPGVESVALAGGALLGGSAWNGFVSVGGAPPGPVLAYFLKVSPGWLGTMKISLLSGRDIRMNDTSPGVAMVNETFVKQFFPGENPLGKTFAKGSEHYEVVAVVRDAPYRDLRESILPVAYVPFHRVDAAGAIQTTGTGTFVVRTSSANPMALAAMLRREVPRARSEFRVSNIRAQSELVRAQTLRERLLAMLALFFAGVALLLAGVGLYGVLDYAVAQRRREIGIRMAIGAQSWDIAGRVTAQTFRVVAVGAIAGVTLGMASARYLAALLYEVHATDAVMLSWPALTIVAAALLSALPAVLRAVRIDPASTLRSE